MNRYKLNSKGKFRVLLTSETGFVPQMMYLVMEDMDSAIKFVCDNPTPSYAGEKLIIQTSVDDLWEDVDMNKFAEAFNNIKKDNVNEPLGDTFTCRKLEQENVQLYLVYVKSNSMKQFSPAHVIASNPTEAAKKVENYLDRNDYGFKVERVVEKVEIVAENVHYTRYDHVLFLKDSDTIIGGK